MNLRGVLPDKAVQAITDLTTKLSTLSVRVETLSGQKFVTRGQADKLYGPERQRADLQVSGSHPLNLSGLVGQLSPVAAGTYTVGAALTGGGNPGTITVGQDGRITAITPAT